MSVIHTQRETRLDLRQFLFLLLITLAIIGFSVRLWYVQVIKAPALAALAEKSGLDRTSRLAPRGLIKDRNGRPIASVQESAVVTIVYDTIAQEFDRKNGDPTSYKELIKIYGVPESVSKVAALLGVTVERLTRPITEASWDPYVPRVIYVGVDPVAASRIAEAGDRLEGFSIEHQPTRTYNVADSLSHVIGYVWIPTEKEVSKLEKLELVPPVYVGRDGIESFYEPLLMGRAGYDLMAVDPSMRPLRSVGFTRPVPGDELVLAIDIELQRLAMRLLDGRKGAVVATDPRTGEVLCLVSSPSYDVHLFDHGISQQNYDMLLADEDLPLVKRAFAGIYPPGSTWKIVTSIAAYLAGEFSTTDTVFCAGYYRLGRQTFGCLGVHGNISFHEAIKKSCNTYFADLAYRSGVDKMREACRMIGVDGKQGLDVPGELPGIVPTADWITRTKRVWQPGHTVQFGFGQGYLAVTPLQMVTVASIVANKGIVYKPHVLLGSRNADDEFVQFEPQLLGEVNASARFWSALQSALVDVIDNGTAGRARIDGLTWAGKTGSSEHKTGAATHAWFVGYAPAQNPTIAISVVIEAVGHGGTFAAPIAKEVVKQYLFGVERQSPEVESSVSRADSASTSSAD